MFKKEEGFSLLELSVAVGVAAIVAVAAVTATTTFIGSAQDKRNSYTTNANGSINSAAAASSALGAP
jgi:prepilin-type N-terminal cleavage/methylation domain-containing protein